MEFEKLDRIYALTVIAPFLEELSRNRVTGLITLCTYYPVEVIPHPNWTDKDA